MIASATSELQYPGDVKLGTIGKSSKRVQEWLTLRRNAVVIDGEFGPASNAALQKFTASRADLRGQNFNTAIWEALTDPMRKAFGSLPGVFITLRAAIVSAAKQHLQWQPREVGGDNCGPWVRAYCGGNDGPEYRWCAGFVSTMVRMSLEVLKVSETAWANRYCVLSLGCTEIGDSAKAKKSLVSGDQNASLIQPGDFGLVRKGSGGWQHIFIVTQNNGDSVETIEGNTNDDGSANGYEVCARTRSIAGKDYVLIRP